MIGLSSIESPSMREKVPRMTTKLADIGAASAGATALLSWLPDLEAILRIGVSAVGIIAGGCAALYHLEAWRQKRRERKVSRETSD